MANFQNLGTIASSIGVGVGSIFQTLTTTGGLSSGAATTVIQQIMGSSTGATEQPILNKIVADFRNPKIVADLVMKAQEVDNLPATTSALLDDLTALAAAAATDPTKIGDFMALVSAIDKSLGLPG